VEWSTHKRVEDAKGTAELGVVADEHRDRREERQDIGAECERRDEDRHEWVHEREAHQGEHYHVEDGRVRDWPSAWLWKSMIYRVCAGGGCR
jgi:hypothetical protein